jgi:spore germination protein
VLNARAGFTPVLEAAPQRRRLTDAVAALAASEHFAGITLDIEEIPPADRAAFTTLVRDIARRLHRVGRRLAVYAPRRTAVPPTRFAAAYDWPRLVRTADLLLASMYNEHNRHGAPGPVTTTAGAGAVLRYASGISRRRIAPVLGAFGYRWPLAGGAATLVSSADASVLGAAPGTVVTPTDGEATFEAGGARVWFETTAGLLSRARQARQAGMRWLALFSLGREPAGTVDRLGTRRRPGCRRSRAVAH